MLPFVAACLVFALTAHAGPSRLDHHAAIAQKMEKRQQTACTKVAAGLSGLSNPANCYTRVATEQIDDPVNGLQVTTLNNWGGGNIPPALRGVFYLEGNPYAAECLSFAASFWNASSSTIDSQLFSPRTWSSDVGSNQLRDNLKNGVTFKTTCKKNFWGRQECLSAEYHYVDNRLLKVGDYSATEVSDNQWTRGSNVPNLPQWPGSNKTIIRYNYNMYRIIDEQGRRTDKWNRNYIANINKTIGPNSWQFMVHLGAFQEVPQRR